ncbi:structural maintenance of chromosomes protein 5-like [Bombina bombina]|uniref:structural maintenance of chromosomes protein 5-like n=1 Tax=Bombina bombina TaxID=8345 RepID=UPI00235A8FBD|nr:structural maintenance of chromosomes protein 5-like [Bombina bombina]
MYQTTNRHNSENEIAFFWFMEPAIIKDLHIAIQWVVKNEALFCGRITMPSYVSMNEDDHQKAIDNVMQREEPEAREPFLFVFQNREDMELFLQACLDQQGLQVNAMFNK